MEVWECAESKGYLRNHVVAKLVRAKIWCGLLSEPLQNNNPETPSA